MPEFKECKKHGLVKHYKDKRYKNTWDCSACNNERNLKRRQKNKQKAIEYKGGKCQMCGYDKCIEALVFHHPISEIKESDISDIRNNSWEKIKQELDKCILLCSNCHAELHYEE